MWVKQLELGPMANYVYLIGDPATHEAAVVDAAWDVPAILAAAAAADYKITQAFVTHNHPDHTNGLAELLRTHDVPVRIHTEDAFALSDIKEAVQPVRGGDKINVGDMAVTFLHTPGHTPGSQCFLFKDQLLTGDTLFVKSCGRVDLPGSDPELMYESLRRLARLDDKTRIFPGHNYSEEKTVEMGVERGQNPFMQACLRLSPEDFRKLVGV
jgi:hydroxyacylglutathione hydrolase